VQISGQEPCPLPEDPFLCEVAVAMRDARLWGEIVDRDWHGVYMTDDLRLSYGGLLELAQLPVVGGHIFGAETVRVRLGLRGGPNTVELNRQLLGEMGPWILADTPGGREGLRELVDPRLRDVVDELQPAAFSAAHTFVARGMGTYSTAMDLFATAVRIRDDQGRPAGTAVIFKPAASAAVLATLAFMGDLRHFERMQQVAKAGRRPAAILFADLESSSPLARRLSTASYFTLGRRLARAADQCVIDAGGLVGRHVGDGVVAFFLAETAGSESAAARACIEAARALRSAMAEMAARSELAPEELIMRSGLHWGATLYVGQITTSGRAEVTALGDEANEGARIEACASGGRALASKELVERLDPEDAAALGLDPDRVTYTPLGELTTATEKARRDAPGIVVCDV
jgi:class 3 adenylate cyclase